MPTPCLVSRPGLYWTCSRPLEELEDKERKPDDKTRRGEADDANYRCRHINPYTANKCERCGSDFDVGVERLDEHGNVINKIKFIAEDGEWFYEDAKKPPTFGGCVPPPNSPSSHRKGN